MRSNDLTTRPWGVETGTFTLPDFTSGAPRDRRPAAAILPW